MATLFSYGHARDIRSQRTPRHPSFCRLLAILLAMTCLNLCGCNVLGADMEAQLQPPRAAGEQQNIQDALDAFVHTLDKSATRYVLKYPLTGDYRSAFILHDLDKDGKEEAIAFYHVKSEESKTHLNLLKRQENGQWRSVSDFEGLGTDVDRVVFGDLEGDGIPELLVGWNLYSSRDKQLMLYSMKSGRLEARDGGTYTSLVVGDITSSGHDELLLLTVATTKGQVTGKLKAMRGDALTELGTIRLDSGIQSFSAYHFGNLADAVTGVYLDAVKDADTTITELVYWNGSRLVVPLYNAAEDITTLSARQSALPSLDIDRDGAVEWPTSIRLPGYEQSDARSAMWLTDWNAYQYATRTVERKFSSIVNNTDGYYLLIEDSWKGKVTAFYTLSTHTLELRYVPTDTPLLAVRTSSDDSYTKASGDDSRSFQTVHTASDGGMVYSAWLAESPPLELDMTKLRYMLTFLPA